MTEYAILVKSNDGDLLYAIGGQDEESAVANAQMIEERHQDMHCEITILSGIEDTL